MAYQKWRRRSASSAIGAMDALNMDVEWFACAMDGKAGGPDASALRSKDGHHAQVSSTDAGVSRRPRMAESGAVGCSFKTRPET